MNGCRSRFKKWVKRCPGDLKKVICVLCNKKTIDIASMSVSAQSHKLKEAILESNSSLYFIQNIQVSPPAASQSTSSAATNKSKSSAPAKQSSSSARAKQSTVISHYTDKAIVKDAEIRWAIKLVMCHFSYRSYKQI